MRIATGMMLALLLLARPGLGSCHEGHEHDEALDAQVLKAGKALQIAEVEFEPAHPTVLAARGALARALIAVEHYDEAKTELRTLLAVQEASLGKEHPDVATTLNQLAGVYQREEDYASAEPLLQRVLEVDQKTYGEADPQIVDDLGNLAVTYSFLKRYDASDAMYRRAIATAERVFGADHAELIPLLEDYFVLLQDTGRSEEAAAVATRLQALQSEHP